jgi:hypothetical protein
VTILLTAEDVTQPDRSRSGNQARVDASRRSRAGAPGSRVLSWSRHPRPGLLPRGPFAGPLSGGLVGAATEEEAAAKPPDVVLG